MQNEQNFQEKLHQAFSKLIEEGKMKTHAAATIIDEIKKAKKSGTFNEKAFFHDMFFTLKELKSIDGEILKNALDAYQKGITTDTQKPADTSLDKK